ncbi:MAG: phytanoyl-CoA dioxygenase family protein [Armatimonadetes bacterium]|nr:phytanoyl-CoA dioxygenase family protein [Armatimonadota bacterium]
MITTIPITSQEIRKGAMRPDHLEEAVRAVREDGVVVLKDVVDAGHIAILREKMQEDVAALLAREDAPFNWNTGNIQQDPPPFPPYLFEDVLLNEMVIAVSKAVLGPGIKNFFYSGNTAVRSEERQPVHADSGHLWKETVTPIYNLVVNVPVVDMTPENGSTEIWPGTHREPAVSIHEDIKIPEEAIRRQRERSAPFQPTVRAGSVVIRDIRLWHAGMPNRTGQPRPMIAMIHAASWFQDGSPLLFPKGAEGFFEHPELRTVARFVESPIDYIRAPHAYEYEQTER